jgi:hypothetical protein
MTESANEQYTDGGELSQTSHPMTPGANVYDESGLIYFIKETLHEEYLELERRSNLIDEGSDYPTLYI